MRLLVQLSKNLTDYGESFSSGADESGKEESQASIIENFLRQYSPSPGDIYAWLWEGEFGLNDEKKSIPPTLTQLREDIYQAQEEENQKKALDDDNTKLQKEEQRLLICEPLGLAGQFVRVNLLPYANADCPLKRLLYLQDFISRFSPDKFRFNQDWRFTKRQVTLSGDISLSFFEEFERRIVFHTFPQVTRTKRFLQKYGPYYRVVPQKLFFRFFPEYTFS